MLLIRDERQRQENLPQNDKNPVQNNWRVKNQHLNVDTLVSAYKHMNKHTQTLIHIQSQNSSFSFSYSI